MISSILVVFPQFAVIFRQFRSEKFAVTAIKQEFLDTLKINIGGTFFCSKAVIPYMKSQDQGCIINLSGGGGLTAHPYYDAYSASKAAIVRMTENIALELEKFDINVTAISPGAVNTEMFHAQLRQDKESIGDENWRALQDQLGSGGE